MGNNKNNDKKSAFIKKYNLKKGDYITNELVRKARTEIGYSQKTTGTDIRVGIISYIDCKPLEKY